MLCIKKSLKTKIWPRKISRNVSVRQRKKAIAENIEKARENNNILTQTIDEEGNLVGVKDTIDFDSREVADAESTKLHNEMVMENAKKKDDEKSLENVD